MAKMENNYSIKEVIEQRFNEMGTHLIDIKTQTTKTNGRVNSLETSRTQLWTSISVLLFLGGTILTLAIMAIDNKVEKSIKNYSPEIAKQAANQVVQTLEDKYLLK